MIKFSRYLLVATAILVGSIVLPALYWTIFEKVPRSPSLFYSCITDDFIIVEGALKRSPAGKEYNTEEYEEVMPLMFFRQLMADGRMPDSIRGVAVEAPSINRAASYYRYTPKKIFAAVPDLWPMLESESGKVTLTMPDDYFRIGRRMEFIVARTNKINEDKSRLFTEALAANGFVFPAGIIAGIPTTRKSVDEGYFITDRNGSLFHVKMVEGEPYIIKIEIPENFDIVYIEAVDLKSREYYCHVFTRDQGIYLLMDEVYELQRLPIDGFNPYVHSLRLNADLFNKCITIYGENWFEAIAIDDMYQVVNNYGEEWEGLFERTDGRIFASVFPFEVRMKDKNSALISFSFRFSPYFRWIIINFMAVILAMIFTLRRKKTLKSNILDFIIVFITGIYGLIATQIFPNKVERVKSSDKK